MLENRRMKKEDDDLLELPKPLECRIIERINRFVLRISIKGSPRLGYINNTGRLQELLLPERTAYCIQKNGGKTEYRVFSINTGKLAALIDTNFQMKAFEKAVEKNMIPWLYNCRMLKRNPRAGESLLDYIFRCGRERVWIEVKSAVLAGEKGCAMYPDCPSLRGRRHIVELTRLVQEKGEKAGIVFIAALPSAKCFKPNPLGDPEIPRLLRQAEHSGVMIKAVSLYYDPAESIIRLENPDLPVVLHENK
jgi:sugar fermentation stimulation protein A